MAESIEANEIVVPDTLEDTVETISKAKAFVPYAHPDFRYMAVLQGTTMDEVLKCLYFYDNAPDMQYITCIGIPRVLTKIRKNFRVLFSEFLINENFHLRFQFHFLGQSPWVREVSALSATVDGYETANWDSPGFRGIDTSFPIYMGIQKILIDHGTVEYQPRPSNYFDSTTDAPVYTERNVAAFLQWAHYG